jgi:hypothetical protein
VPTLTMNQGTGRCDHCHMNLKPAVIVSSMDHNTITGDCSGCHNYPGTGTAAAANWLGASGFNHAPTPATCYNCHSNKVPAGTVPNTKDGFNHAATYGTECKACHAVVTANIGVRWSGGFFNHNSNNLATFTNCSPCHDTKKHNAGQNWARSGCHTASFLRWPTPSSTGNFGGSWGQP